MCSLLFISVLVACAFDILSKKLLPRAVQGSFTLSFLLEVLQFLFFHLAFDPLQVISCEWYKIGVQFHYFAHRYPVFPSLFTEETLLSPFVFWHCCQKLVYATWVCLGLNSFLFHWSTCLFPWQYQSVLITITL